MTVLPKNIVLSVLTMKDVINPLGGIHSKSKKTISKHEKLQIAKYSIIGMLCSPSCPLLPNGLSSKDTHEFVGNQS
jgi:hypothetical protein